MMTESWFEAATDNLRRSFNEGGMEQINGFEFLANFLSDSSLIDALSSTSDYGVEEIEEVVRNHIDKFEIWLKKNASDWLSVGRRYKWSLLKAQAPPKRPIGTEPDKFTFTPTEMLLRKKDFSALTSDDTHVAYELYQKAVNTDDKDFIADCALRVAWSKDDQLEDYSNRARSWNIAGDETKKSKNRSSFPWYVKAAEIHARNMSHFESSRIYEKAIRQGIEETLEIKKLLQIVRACKQQFELAGDSEGASRIFVKENDIKRKASKGKERFFLSCYKFLCNYGETPRNVLCSALVVILICGIAYSLGGIYSSKELTVINDLLTGIYFSIVTFTTLGYGDFSPASPFIRAISAFEAISGLFLTSLFLATVIRKYSR